MKLKQRQEPRFKFVEMKHGVDLFTAPEHFSLAHCVDKTFAMRRGIAKEFAEKFQRRNEHQNMKTKLGEVATLKDKKRHIGYLRKVRKFQEVLRNHFSIFTYFKMSLTYRSLHVVQ
jgi:hypothetical protein